MSYISSDADLVKNANRIREVTVAALVSEGFLSKEDAKRFLLHYALMLHKQGWLGRVMGKMFKYDSEDTAQLNMVKMVEGVDLDKDDENK